MPTNNPQIKLVSPKVIPLTVTQCTTDFSVLLSQDNSSTQWLSLFPIVSQVVRHFIKLPQPLLIFNALYWQAATAVIKACCDKNKPSFFLQNYDQQTLFGRINLKHDKNSEFKQGKIYQLNEGILILHISPLLVTPDLWFLLKAFLISSNLPATSALNGDKLKGQLPISPLNKLNTKIVLVANRYQLDELAQIDPEYNQVGTLFTELAADIKSNKKNIKALQNYCYLLIQQRHLPEISEDAVALLFHHLSALCEHQNKLLFSPELIEHLLHYAQLFCVQNNPITAKELQQVLDIQIQSQSLAENFSDQALLEKQLKIQLSGTQIGQINGLSVVELIGYPTEFGEVFRISVSDMVGDGEIIDVERKVELAGNIHAKSTLIVQGYLNHFFTHINNFPLSCNVVFEQSYQESDGDSASLAILLAVTSCYSQQPIKQNLFVTGALDQHGNVLAIGGINQKIHAITRLFKLNLLNEAVTILIPKANQINLILDKETLTLIDADKINIFAIDHCQEAFPMAMEISFKTILELIKQRIEHLHREEASLHSDGFLSRFLQHFRS